MSSVPFQRQAFERSCSYFNKTPGACPGDFDQGNPMFSTTAKLPARSRDQAEVSFGVLEPSRINSPSQRRGLVSGRGVRAAAKLRRNDVHPAVNKLRARASEPLTGGASLSQRCTPFGSFRMNRHGIVMAGAGKTRQFTVRRAKACARKRCRRKPPAPRRINSGRLRKCRARRTPSSHRTPPSGANRGSYPAPHREATDTRGRADC